MRITGHCLGVLLLAVGAAGGAEPNDPVSHSFKIMGVSSLEKQLQQNKRQNIGTETEFRYTWKSADRERTLVWDLLKFKGTADGSEGMSYTASAEKFVTTKGGETIELTAADAPDAIKKVLKDSFGAPMCIVQFDEAGKETERKVVAGPGAKEFVDGGMIANGFLFHPRFMRDEDKWTASLEMAAGLAATVKGNVSYKKLRTQKNRCTVSVAGELTAASIEVPGKRMVMENVKYVVKGEQTYDLDQHEWSSGKLTLEISMDEVEDKKLVAMLKGTSEWTMEMLTEKK